MSNIILTTLNARYIHCSLGLRYIFANMGELKQETEIQEYIIDARPIDIAEKLLDGNPKIIGFGIYIWNIEQTTQLVSIIKRIDPEVIIILGGPEVSFEYEQQPICKNADYIISGAADLEFPGLCRQLTVNDKPNSKFISALPIELSSLKFPYQFYNEEDIANRVIYVEASRGCPFKCEFCISALDKTAWTFDLDSFLQQMENLFQRGARHFKFVDRTFNLKVQSSIKILEFFLDHMDNSLFLHFELIPDHLPEQLKAIIQKFPEGSLQFEIGIQSFNPEIQSIISRKQNNKKSEDNIRWLKNETNAHLHTDLIMGLPGEDLQSIASGFDQLIKLNPHEIQMGILKRLRGTPIIRHTDHYKMRYNPNPPYNILHTLNLDFSTMQRLSRFARYWDMIANSGRFKHTKPYLLGKNPFHNFLKLSDWLFKQTNQTHKISLPRLFELLYQALTSEFAIETIVVIKPLWLDYLSSGLKGTPSFADNSMITIRNEANKKLKKAGNLRQTRHSN